MDEKRISGSYLIISEEKHDNLYPMCFGVSCAFFALRLLTAEQPHEMEEDDKKCCELREKMLQGSAHILGLLVWRIQREEKLLQKLETSEKKIEELKKRRHEDAKANEKVVSIFASQEQGWLIEKKKLRHQIGALVNELRLLEKKKDEEMGDLGKKLNELEMLVESKEKIIEEMEQKGKELEESVMKFQCVAEDLRETAKREAQEHSTELWKHKSAFIEIVSNQRQLEAETRRAFRQVEDAKMELEAVREQKEESVLLAQKLSVDIAKMRKDSEQKEKILSAMMRKSKLDAAEKQLLMKEVKVTKAKKKQAELETEKWRAVSKSRHDHQRHYSLKAIFAKQATAKLDVSSGLKEVSNSGKTRSQSTDIVFELDPKSKPDPEVFSPSPVCHSPAESEDLVMADVKKLESWVRAEAEKYAAVTENRHHLELDAFAEQMRSKDEKLEVLRWRLLSMELETKRLQSTVEGLNQDLSQLRQDNSKLEALVMEREEELDSLKQQFPSQLKTLHDPALTHDHHHYHHPFWPKVKIVKKKSTEKDQKEEEVVKLSPDQKEFEEEKEANGQCLSHNKTMKTKNPWRLDLHALGVSYKIKRLKQQLLMLERLTGKQESGAEDMVEGGGDKGMIKGFLLLISLLNKQVSRYQSLQGKIDDLCKRMHDNDLDTSQGDCSSSSTTKSKGERRTLEDFLEETFQLQRYMVATGQKLMEIQSKIGSGFVGVERFSDNMRCLFQEVQRGLEVRIARIIGDLEGTLDCGL